MISRLDLKDHLERHTESSWTCNRFGLIDIASTGDYILMVRKLLIELNQPYTIEIIQRPNNVELIQIRC